MKAIVQDRYGSPDVLELRDVATPVPADNEVLVRIHAASVNAADWHFMRGDPYIARLSLGLGGPKAKIRGRDFAGRVEAVGKDVTGLHPGDEVYGETDGAFAEYVCAVDTVVGPKPAGLTFEQAAAIPLAANTALVGLREGRLQAGQRLLVNGASGGVGPFAVQLGKAFGAEVTGVCSTRNVDQTRSLGADHVIDYTQEDFTENGRRYDVILDLAGNRSLSDLRSSLEPSGTLLLSGGGVFDGGGLLGPVGLLLRGRALSPFVRQRLKPFLAAQHTDNLATLRELAEAGRLAPIVERTYPLGEVPQAIRHLETEHARAKLVITVP